MFEKINIIKKQRKKLYKQVFLAVRKERLILAAFIRVSSGVVGILGAFIIFLLMIGTPSDEENAILYKFLMVVITVATVALKITDRIAQAEDLSRTDGEYRKKYLDLYAECHEAASGFRKATK